MSKNVCKNISKTFLDHTKQFSTHVPKKTLKRKIPKKAAEAGDVLIGNKSNNESIQNSPQNNSETD